VTQDEGTNRESAPGDSPERPSGIAGSGPLILRGVLGGVLMGLANLVPGISGGTMLVSAGVYPRFVASIAELSTLRIRATALLVVGVIGGSALAAIVLLAGTVKDLVVDHRWIMYSLFIGLTLGGLPVVWRMARPADGRLWTGAAGGFAAMAALAIFQGSGGAGDAGTSFGLLVLGGLAGASAMILPGISGGYLLLVLGQYVPILAGIDAFKTALRSGDPSAAWEPATTVILPVAIGVVVGIVAVSNAVRWFLRHHEKATLGVLIGLLVGAVLGLWPFQRSVEPVLGETVVKGRVVTAENLTDFDPEDLPTEYFPPAPWQLVASLALVAAGFGVTTGVAHLGRERPGG
jgi:putative membrane protein